MPIWEVGHSTRQVFLSTGLTSYFKIYGLDPKKGAPTLEEYLATVHEQDRDFMADTIKRCMQIVVAAM